ncbi:hypothetical protein PVK06_012414 [Gossypium arboreum]|uniref:Dol-P-Glc:Glc(2)Man(9)GlcNAc(2)-PP-Dol alpha-1,2-glucosyltransferase n=1 Tax=Gossypium arboreum TaxID=29729 RepID=A0ABR0QBC5_GOSAR|nr:hypothetical protein PVK06_012414 [Gossypium arboreum]
MRVSTCLKLNNTAMAISGAAIPWSPHHLALLCSILVYEIMTHLRPALDDTKSTVFATILALYPVHWFFTFLYYTDVASLTAVLAMYLARLKKKYLFSALFVNPYTSVNVRSNLRKRKSMGNAEANKQSFYWTNSTNTSSASQTSGLLYEISAIVLTS